MAAEGLGEMLTITVIVFKGAGPTVSSSRTDTMMRTINQEFPTSLHVIEAADQSQKHTTRFRTWGVIVNANVYNKPEVEPTDPTRIGMLSTVQPDAVENKGCPVNCEGTHGEGRLAVTLLCGV